MASLRRPHRKSRKGCRECKRRKVKCDEIQPSCFNCTRYRVPCSYGVDSKHDEVWSPPTETADSHASGSPPAEPQPRNHALVEPRLLDSTGIVHLSPSWGRDLELMHHYCTVTSNTMACQEAARHVWRVVFPQEGYTHDYLMHGVLSLSALHKAFLVPNRRDIYLRQSSFHYSIGQKTFTALLPNVTSANWQPVFCFATIVIAYVLSLSIRSSCGSQLEATPISRTLELFSVTKGIKAILSPFILQLNHTHLAPLVTSVWLVSIDPIPDPKPSLEYSVLPHDVFNALSGLHHVLFEKESAENKSDYVKAITILEVSAVQAAYAHVNVEVGTILLWPFFLPDSVVADIRDRKLHGLVLLAYYAVFVNALGRTYWFLRGWGRKLLEDIENQIGDEQSMDLLAWPRRQIFDD